MATPQVEPLMLIRVPTEKYRGAEGEVFACLRQIVLRKRIDGPVKLSKVVGWEANGLASVIIEGLVVVVVVAERLAVATGDRKVIIGG